MTFLPLEDKDSNVSTRSHNLLGAFTLLNDSYFNHQSRKGFEEVKWKGGVNRRVGGSGVEKRIDQIKRVRSGKKTRQRSNRTKWMQQKSRCTPHVLGCLQRLVEESRLSNFIKRLPTN